MRAFEFIQNQPAKTQKPPLRVLSDLEQDKWTAWLCNRKRRFLKALLQYHQRKRALHHVSPSELETAKTGVGMYDKNDWRHLRIGD